MKNIIFAIISLAIIVVSHQETFAHEFSSSDDTVYHCIIANSERDVDGYISGDSWIKTKEMCERLFKED